MFSLAIVIGIYSYLLFCFGILGVFTKHVIISGTLCYFLVCLWYFRKAVFSLAFFSSIQRFYLSLLGDTVSSVLFLLIVLQCLINFVGTLGPELGFDALWYHLTLPKVFLMDGAIHHISGGLLYYSDMPKLMEMLYGGALSFGNEIAAKFVHFGFGILIMIVLYKMSRMFFDRKISLLVVTIFSSNLVFDWESITAYVDLGLTFFSIAALWAFLLWEQTRKRTYLLDSAVMVGLAICVKTLGLAELGIFIPLVLFVEFREKKSLVDMFSHIGLFLLLSVLVPLPWFAVSYMYTGNAFYPFFTHFYQVGFAYSLLNPSRFFGDVWNIFMWSPDPLSPVYLLFFPLLAGLCINFLLHRNEKTPRVVRILQNPQLIVGFYSLLGIVVWYITPRTGGGRFILPFLPGLSLLMGYVFVTQGRWLRCFLFVLIVTISVISIGYRGVANMKYLPVIFGQETKADFLSHQLHFSYGDFYDIEGYFASTLTSNDRVLLYGMHNLYYVDFPFIDSSWVMPGDRFTYILVQNGSLPRRFWFFKEVYRNMTTHVVLYTYGRREWIY